MAKHTVHFCDNPKLHGAGYADGGMVFDRLNLQDLPVQQVMKGNYSDTPGGGYPPRQNSVMDNHSAPPEEGGLRVAPKTLDQNQYPGDERYVPGRIKSTRSKM